MPELKKKKQFNFQYLLLTRRNLVIAIALAAVSILIAVLFLIPNLQKVQSISADIKREKAKLTSLNNKNNILQNVQSTKLYEKKDKIQVILPSLKPVLPLLNEIERISTENSIIVSEFGIIPGEISTQSAEAKAPPKAVNQNPNLDSIETKLVVIGKIENINNFLKAINKITPMTETTELGLKGVNRQDLVQDNKLSDSNVFEATLTLKSYFYIGTVQADPAQPIPDQSTYSDEDIAVLDAFQIPISSQIPVNINIQGGGKEDLFQ